MEEVKANCAKSRQSFSYQQAINNLKMAGMVYPNNQMFRLQLQPFETFAYIFGLVYCLDACVASQNSYKSALSKFKKHTIALQAMYNDQWRVMFWHNQRIRIVNLKTL
jgi:hypothetical protein